MLKSHSDYYPVGISCPGGHSKNRAMPHWCWVSDLCPFGSIKPATSWVADSMGYRYGFNNMEKDDELKGLGSSYDFGARIYDPRVGRWLAVDPLAGKYPDLSPYVFVANSPLIFVDPDGRKIKPANREASTASLRLIKKYDKNFGYENNLFNISVEDVYIDGDLKGQIIGIDENYSLKDFRRSAKKAGYDLDSDEYKSAETLFLVLKTENIYEILVITTDSYMKEVDGYSISTQNSTFDQFRIDHWDVESNKPIIPEQEAIDNLLENASISGTYFGYFANENSKINTTGMLILNPQPQKPKYEEGKSDPYEMMIDESTRVLNDGIKVLPNEP